MSSDTLQIAPEWRQWTADNLLRGADRDEVIGSLCEAGVPRERAEELVREFSSASLFAAACVTVRDQTSADAVLRLERERLRDFEIERRADLSGSDFHRHYRAANRPVLLPDFLRDSPALSRWSHAWFAENFRGVPIPFRDRRSGEAKTSELPVDELVALFESTPDPSKVYSMSRNDVLRAPPFDSLSKDLVYPPGYVFERSHGASASLWFGPATTITPLHYDNCDLLFAQISGRKRVQLVAPAFDPLVARFRAQHLVPEPLVEALFASGVRVHELEVEPGETLFIPVGWYHRVTALSASITVSINGFPNNHTKWYAPPGV